MTDANQNQKKNTETPESAGKGSAERPPEATAKPVRRKNFHITVYDAWCKKCGICVAFCPFGALREHETTQQVIGTDAKCTGCHQCEWRCPDFAIVIKPVATKPAAHPTAGKKPEGKE